MRVLDIALKDLLRSFRSAFLLVMMFVAPLLLTGLIYFAFGRVEGMVTAGKLLAETALGTDRYFQAFPDYGPERMGAPIRAFTRLSPKPITIHAQIEQPDVVLVLDPTLLGTVAVTEGLKEKGTLEEMVRDITNTPVLGAFARATGIFDLQELAEQLRAWFGKKIPAQDVEANIRAMRRAADELRRG